MSRQLEQITPQLQQYISENSLREATILRQLRDETSTMEFAQMQVAPEVALFLQFQIKLINAKSILELGTFTGYSSLAMAQVLPEDGHLITCDINQEWTNIAKRYWQQANLSDKIELRLAPALETLSNLLNQGQTNNFDLVFIDANKNDYVEYYQQTMRLIRVGGLIVVDNALWGGKVADPDINDSPTRCIRQLNETAYADTRTMVSLLPLGDGLLLVQKILE